MDEITDVEVLCNKCGNSLMQELGRTSENSHKEPYGMVEYTYRGGFMSDPLEDGHAYTFSVCEPCLSSLFKSFTIPVGVAEYNIHYGSVYTSEERQQKYNEIYYCPTSNMLANYLLDNDEGVRGFAKFRIEQLRKEGR